MGTDLIFCCGFPCAESGWMQTDMTVPPDQLPAVTGGKPGAWMSMICCLAAALNFRRKSCISIGEGWHVLGALQFKKKNAHTFIGRNMPLTRGLTVRKRLDWRKQGRHNWSFKAFPDNNHLFWKCQLCLWLCLPVRPRNTWQNMRVPAWATLTTLLFCRRNRSKYQFSYVLATFSMHMKHNFKQNGLFLVILKFPQLSENRVQAPLMKLNLIFSITFIIYCHLLISLDF